MAIPHNDTPYPEFENNSNLAEDLTKMQKEILNATQGSDSDDFLNSTMISKSSNKSYEQL